MAPIIFKFQESDVDQTAPLTVGFLAPNHTRLLLQSESVLVFYFIMVYYFYKPKILETIFIYRQ